MGSFWEEALPWAIQAHNATRVFISVILAQWADETDYGRSIDWSEYHNPGNVSPWGEAVYPNIQAGVNAYTFTMNNGYYQAVRVASNWLEACYALGESPWASAHYEADGGPPGEDLVKIVEANNLTQYDAPQPPPEPPVPALAKPAVAVVSTPSGNGYWIFASDGGVFAEGDAVFHGSAANLKLNAPIVGADCTPDGGGYWLVGADGGIFSFGNAPFRGNAIP